MLTEQQYACLHVLCVYGMYVYLHVYECVCMCDCVCVCVCEREKERLKIKIWHCAYSLIDNCHLSVVFKWW